MLEEQAISVLVTQKWHGKAVFLACVSSFFMQHIFQVMPCGTHEPWLFLEEAMYVSGCVSRNERQKGGKNNKKLNELSKNKPKPKIVI